MGWILFDEADHRRPAPPFHVDTSDGKQVALADFHEKANLVLVFLHDAGCPACAEAVRQFALRGDDYARLDSQVVILLQEAPAAAGLPGLVATDPGGQVRGRYAALMDESLTTEKDCLLFVLDQYGAPYAAYIARELNQPGLQDDILKWLEFVGIQCPE